MSHSKFAVLNWQMNGPVCVFWVTGTNAVQTPQLSSQSLMSLSHGPDSEPYQNKSHWSVKPGENQVPFSRGEHPSKEHNHIDKTHENQISL